MRELTGAEAAIVVNNGAAAVLLSAAALAGPGRGIVVARGQLVEIGGGFRIPEVIAQSGARMVEVGTTNRTRLSDYERALDAHDDVDAIMRVHQSNFRTIGFVEDVPIGALCELGVPVIDDVGSGWVGGAVAVEEPAVADSVAAGAALVCCSGDKLLGGPAGRADSRPAGRGGGRAPPPAGSGDADRQAVAGSARGDAPALPRSATRAERDPNPGDAGRRRAHARARAGRAGGSYRRPCASDRGRRPGSAVARCRCSSSRGRRWRSKASLNRSPRHCAGRAAGGRPDPRRAACCSTRAR